MLKKKIKILSTSFLSLSVLQNYAKSCPSRKGSYSLMTALSNPTSFDPLFLVIWCVFPVIVPLLNTAPPLQILTCLWIFSHKF